MAMKFGLSNIRSLCSCLNNVNEEKTHFAKYEHSGDERELELLNNVSTNKGDATDEVEQYDDSKKITEWQAGWNITNAIQGMLLVSLPYTVLQAGYWSLVAMVVIGYICCYTAKIIIQCLYEKNEEGDVVRVRNSYVQIADHVLGETFGGKLVNCTQIGELTILCTLYILICGELLNGSFPNLISMSSWMMLSTCFVLPCAFLQTLRSVSLFSFWCTVAHLVINAIVLIYCCTQISEWQWSEVQLRVDLSGCMLAFGFIVFSYTSQILVPTIEGNMLHPDQFNYVTNASHAVAVVFKIIFAYAGFLTWSWQTQKVISNNLPTQQFKIIINLCLVAKALLSYPLIYFTAVELIEAAMFQGRLLTLFPVCIDERSKLKIWAVGLRCGLILAITTVAVIFPHLVIVCSMIGSINGALLSFILPCWFHIKMKWQELRCYQKAADVFVIVLGIISGAAGVYYSVHALLQEMH